MAGRWLYACERFVLGEFHLPPGDEQWGRTNVILGGHLIAFPRTAVRIHHQGRRDAVVAGSNEVVLYRPWQEYRRELVDPNGDHCTYLVPLPLLLDELGGDAPFAHTHLPSPPRPYALQRLAAAAAAGGADRLATEETMIRAIGAVLAGEPLRTGNAAVERTKEVLAVRFADDLSLSEIAGEVHVSAFHLARTFRANTGSTIHAYRNHLRLRASLEMLTAGRGPLAAIAAACGFSSHAHYTDAFRRVFGTPPSRATAEEMSKMLEARLDPAG